MNGNISINNADNLFLVQARFKEKSKILALFPVSQTLDLLLFSVFYHSNWIFWTVGRTKPAMWRCGLGILENCDGNCYYFSIILYYSTCKQTHSITGKLQKIEQKCVSLWLHVSVLNAETRTWNWFTASQFNKKANVDPNPSCLGEPETASYCPAVIQMERSDGGKTDLHLGRTYSLYALHAWRMRSTFQRCFWEVGWRSNREREPASGLTAGATGHNTTHTLVPDRLQV